MSDEHRDLTTDHERRLAELPKEHTAPAALEERVLDALRERGQFRAPPRDSIWRLRRIAGLAAAALVAFVVGFGTGRQSSETMGRGEYMLLLYEGPEWQADTPDNFSDRFEDYNRWIATLRATNHFVTGEQLDSTGVVLVPGVGATEHQRLSRSEDGIVGAMFLIRADSYDQAVSIARSAPHLRYGGRIAVRLINPI